MKGKLLCLSAAVLAAVAGCSSTPEPAPEPLKVNAVYQERCYSMDHVEQEVAGRAYLEKGQQFYYQLDCAKHLNLSQKDPAGVDVAGAGDGSASGAGAVVSDDAGAASAAASSEPGSNAVAVASAASDAGSKEALSAAGSTPRTSNWAESQPKAPKEPTCYFDKETAGRGDLPPCPWDEDKQEFIKE